MHKGQDQVNMVEVYILSVVALDETNISGCLHFSMQKVEMSCMERYGIWASAQENLSSEVCKQLRSRPACASMQSDQHLCYSLIGKYNI